MNVCPLRDSFLQTTLPPSLFTEDGSLRGRVQAIARDTSALAVIWVVDKGPGQLWGFCRAWAWDALHAFMREQGYTRATMDAVTIFRELQHDVSHHTSPKNPKACLALLYLIGKAKSGLRLKSCGDLLLPLLHPLSPAPTCVLPPALIPAF